MLGTKPVVGVLLGRSYRHRPGIGSKAGCRSGPQGSGTGCDHWRSAGLCHGPRRSRRPTPRCRCSSSYEEIPFPLEQPVLLDYPTVDPAELGAGQGGCKGRPVCLRHVDVYHRLGRNRVRLMDSFLLHSMRQPSMPVTAPLRQNLISSRVSSAARTSGVS